MLHVHFLGGLKGIQQLWVLISPLLVLWTLTLGFHTHRLTLIALSYHPCLLMRHHLFMGLDYWAPIWDKEFGLTRTFLGFLRILQMGLTLHLLGRTWVLILMKLCSKAHSLGGRHLSQTLVPLDLIWVHHLLSIKVLGKF